jgi:hypothetical protein
MTKGIRKDPLDIALAKKKAIEDARADLDKAAKPLDDEIAVKLAEREKTDNEYLGAVVRLLLKNDSGLRHKLVAHANEVIEHTKHKVKARASLLRTLGPLPAPDTSAPAAVSLKPAAVEFSRTGK